MGGMDVPIKHTHMYIYPRPNPNPTHTCLYIYNTALLSLEARLAMNDTAAFTTVLEASFASGRVIEVGLYFYL